MKQSLPLNQSGILFLLEKGGEREKETKLPSREVTSKE
jgi:hypothetical protein